MAAGPELTKGVEEREARIKEFAMRIRAAANRIAGGKQVGIWFGCNLWMELLLAGTFRTLMCTAPWVECHLCVQAVRKYKTDDVVNDTPLPEFKVHRGQL
jgi:hypothetical protein